MSYLEPVNYQRDNNGLNVFVRDNQSGRTFRCEGRIAIDGVVEPMKVCGYRHDEDAEAIASMAETYVDAETPYTVYDRSGETWHYTKTLRGLTFGERHNFDRLDQEQLKQVAQYARAVADEKVDERGFDAEMWEADS